MRSVPFIRVRESAQGRAIGTDPYPLGWGGFSFSLVSANLPPTFVSDQGKECKRKNNIYCILYFIYYILNVIVNK